MTRTPHFETQKDLERSPSPPSFQKQDLRKSCRGIGKQDWPHGNPSQGNRLRGIAALGTDRCMGRASKAPSPSEAVSLSLSCREVSCWEEGLKPQCGPLVLLTPAQLLFRCRCTTSPEMTALNSLPRFPRLILLHTFCLRLGEQEIRL